MAKRLLKFFYLFLWLFAGVLFSWFVFHHTRADAINVIRLLTYVAPWLTIAALCASLCAWFGKRFKLAVTLTILTLLLALPYIPQFLPKSTPAITSQTLKVITYSTMGRNDDHAAMARVYAQHLPDLAFFQEVGQGTLEELIRKSMPEIPLHFAATDNVGFIVSRYPLQATKKDKNPYARIVMQLPEETVSLWNVHTRKAIHDTALQHKQVRALADAVSQQEGPVIVAGDFNATQLTETYGMMAQHLANAHAEAGFGFGFTFPSHARRLGTFLPFLRIDHIFYSEHFQALDCYVGDDAGGSDHFPVVATLQLKR